MIILLIPVFGFCIYQVVQGAFSRPCSATGVCMSSTTATMLDPAVERQQAITFVTDLIICRHHIQSYPESHPIVAAALQKTIASLAPLVADGKPFILGISRRGVLLKSEVLGPEIVKFRDFAILLASFGVITISFSVDLRGEDIHLLSGIVSRPRMQVWETGGIIHAFEAAGIKGITVQAIDPSVFVLTDDFRPGTAGEPADPWDIFVRKLMDGFFSVSREKMKQLISGPPAELARNFDAILADIPEEAHYQTVKILADFFTAMDQRQGIQKFSEDALDKIASFVTGISPRLRRDFILNVCNSTRITSGFSERLLQRLPGDALLEAMHSVATHGDKIPEMVLNIMRKLSAQAETTPALDIAITDAGSTEMVRSLLRRSAPEKFVPSVYQQALMTILATDALPAAETKALNELRKSLENDRLEAKISDIIFEIIKVMPAEERGDGIKRNLVSLMSHYLAKMDFRSIEQACRMIDEEAPASDRTVFSDPGFVQEVLNSASLLGRESHEGIRSLIRTVGQPFVIPLMERLFDETNRSMRRFWFDCLGDLGEMVRDAALERLNDERWYVIRNLIIMLRGFSDQDVQRQIRRFVKHSHPKVRHEALKNLLCYHDPKVDNLLLHDLESTDPARKLAAVQIAELSSKPEIVHKLLAMLDAGSITNYDLEMKSAIVRTLAAIGNEQALPKLKEILLSASLLHPGKHTRLKTAIIHALPRFPASRVRPLLEEIAASGGKSIAPLAAEALKGLQGSAP